MTVKKAVEGLDFLIKNKQKLKEGLFVPEKEWNKGEPRIDGFLNNIVAILQTDIDNLCAVKKHLQPKQRKLRINCRHPKKDTTLQVMSEILYEL